MKSKKVLIIISLIIIVAIIVSTIFIIKNNKNDTDGSNQSNQNFKETEDNSKINVSKELNKTKEFDGFRISNIKFTEKEGEVILIADVTNVSEKDTEKLTYFNIIFLDNENKEIGTFPGVINSVKKNETTTLNSSVNGDIANYINAYDFKLEIDNSR